MNWRTLNDCISIAKKEMDIYQNYEKSPLFLLGMSEGVPRMWEKVEKDEIFNENNLHLPFKACRVIQTNKMSAKDGVGNRFEKAVSLAYCFSYEAGRVEAIGFAEDLGRVGCYLLHSPIENLNQLWDNSFDDRAKLDGAKCQGFQIKPHVFYYRDKNYDNHVGSNSSAALQMMLEFISLVNCPRHFVAQVRPDQESRSVEWKEARTHYIILGPEHAKGISEKGICKKFDGSITRSMHNRRAHFRRLTSERFVHKKGLKVWVRATWVGPENWKDTSNNIYQIVQKKHLPF